MKVVRLAALALGAVVAASLVVILALRWIPPPTTSFIVQHRIASWWSRSKVGPVERRWVGWARISPEARIAVVAAEDQKFPEHWGFDTGSIHDAWREHEEGGRLRGASTITQQVAKNLFLWPGQSFVRKGIEAFLTLELELCWPKRRILEVYLNVAEFGEGVYGVEAASERFYRKPASHLDREEAALLAAVLPNPERLRVDRPSGYVRERRDWVVRQIEQLGGPAYLKDM